MYNDFLNYPNNYINKKLTNFNQQLENIVNQRNTTYLNKAFSYLISLSNIDSKLIIKIHNCIMKYNSRTSNKKNDLNVKVIQDVIDVFDKINDDELNKRINQLETLTKFHEKKMNQNKEIFIEEKRSLLKDKSITKSVIETKRIECKKRRTKKKDVLFNQTEIDLINEKLKNVEINSN